MKVDDSPLGIASAVAQTIVNSQRADASQSPPKPAPEPQPGVVVTLSAQGLALSKLAQQTDKSMFQPQSPSAVFQIAQTGNVSALSSDTAEHSIANSIATTIDARQQQGAIESKSAAIQQTSVIVQSSSYVPLPEKTLPQGGYLGAIATNLATNRKSTSQTNLTSRKAVIKSLEQELLQVRNDPNLSEQEKYNRSLEIGNELKAAEQSLKIKTEPKATKLTNTIVNHIPTLAQGAEIVPDPAKRTDARGQESTITTQIKHRRRQVTEQILNLYRSIEAS